MPGPGVDLLGVEELAELNDVIASGHLSGFGPDDSGFPANVCRFEEAMTASATRAIASRRGQAPDFKG